VLPAKLAPGNYVIRHEIIALHGGQNVNGAQLYPQCKPSPIHLQYFYDVERGILISGPGLNLKVGGSGSVAPTAGVPGTSLYTKDMPGVVFNIYTNPTTYTFPGPALWTAAN
jgi:cellulase